ncbi:MAG: hypothetical protein ACTH43_15100 [Brachybacterium sp.]|uniref:hypothetical protein n=1 Tax=Brachybacterium sp. TaxID=1891286 RepID=UPI003F8E192B
MPTFHDPLADADEASEALRALAHATRSFDDPAQTYRVFGDLLAGVRSLEQVLDQLAAAHLTHRGRAHDDNGDPLAGTHAALAAADELHRSRVLLDQAEVRLSSAFSHSGRIAWHPEPTQPETVQHDPVQQEPATASVRRWVSVVFLQGSEADEVLDLIDAEGTDAAIEQLKGYDYGEETTQAALENGHVFDEPPTSALDRLVTDQSGYALTYNHFAGNVSLLRTHSIPAPDALGEHGAVSARSAVSNLGASRRSTGVRREPDPSWFGYPGVAAVKQARGLSR